MLNTKYDQNVSISLIVPALNEEGVVSQVLNDIHTEASEAFTHFEMIVIDDGSTDATGALMDEFGARHDNVRVIHNNKNIGLGAAFKLGASLSQNRYVMLLCGDGGLPARSLPSIFANVGKADLVIPYMRNLKRIKTPSRYLLSRTYVLLLNTLFGFRLNYYNGLPIYPKLLLDSINITSSGFGFQGEILIKLLKSGCSYIQVEVDGAEETGNSHALKIKNIFSVGNTFLHLIGEILKFKPIPYDLILKSRALK